MAFGPLWLSALQLKDKIWLYVRNFFQDPIGREIKTTVKIRWRFAQRCCSMPLVCPSFTSLRTGQFWARSEHVNIPKTVGSPAKYEVRAVIRFLHAEGCNAAEIHRRMSNVYGEAFMSDSNGAGIWTSVRLASKSLHHCRTLLSLMKVSQYALLIRWWISAAFHPSA